LLGRVVRRASRAVIVIPARKPAANGIVALVRLAVEASVVTPMTAVTANIVVRAKNVVQI